MNCSMVKAMATGDNMNSDPLNITSDYPVTLSTPGSDFSNLLLLLQILFQTKKFHQQPEQKLQITPNITWSQNSFTTDKQPHPKESKTTQMGINDVSKLIEKRKRGESLTTVEHILRKRQARQNDKDILEQMSRMYTEIQKRYQTITSLKKELETCRNATSQDRQSEIDALHADIKKQVTDIRNLTERIADLELTIQDYQEQNTNLEIKNKQQFEEIKDLKEELETMRGDTGDSCHSIRDLQPFPVPIKIGIWHHMMLSDNFGPGSKIVIRGKTGMSVHRMNFNLYSLENIALHIDNRWDYTDFGHRLILNTYQDFKWGEQVLIEPEPINKGENFVLTIQSLEKEFKICINNDLVLNYTHRFPPSRIYLLVIENADVISSIYYHGYI